MSRGGGPPGRMAAWVGSGVSPTLGVRASSAEVEVGLAGSSVGRTTVGIAVGWPLAGVTLGSDVRLGTALGAAVVRMAVRVAGMGVAVGGAVAHAVSRKPRIRPGKQ